MYVYSGSNRSLYFVSPLSNVSTVAGYTAWFVFRSGVRGTERVGLRDPALSFVKRFGLEMRFVISHHCRSGPIRSGPSRSKPSRAEPAEQTRRAGCHMKLPTMSSTT